ncbi:MAG: class III signal peptide-containing protein [Acidimicrobiia bacterium]|nr:class III signal peptide-containing protein [Actinomycetota bacterium]MBL6924126.1 class III signal peptide-containing protein [Acidimicrobiia bacterium]MBL6926282.1 class III signal peptide-containing protein [Acidimicrobiia bacterium]
MQRLFIRFHVHLLTLDDRGQTTAEYVLLILGAATIAILVTSWATGTDKITGLFDKVLNSLIDKVA